MKTKGIEKNRAFRNRQVAGSSPALGSRIPRQKRGLRIWAAAAICCLFLLFLLALAVFALKGRLNAGFLHKFILRGNLDECPEYGNAVAALSTTRAGDTEALRNLSYRESFW